jgi:hypothetical protein
VKAAKRPRSRRYSSRAAAVKGCRSGEVVVAVCTPDGWEFGVLPGEVVVESATGVVSTPIAVFLGGYFGIVESEARRKVAG